MGIDFFRPKILTHFSGFSVGLHNYFYGFIAWYHGFTAKYILQLFCYDFMIKSGKFIFRSKKSKKVEVNFRNFRAILTFFDPSIKFLWEFFGLIA